MASASVNIAVLDDYQHCAENFADWSRLRPRANLVFFHDHVADPAELAARLAPFEAVVLMRERTPIDAALLARLPALKLIASVGMWNAGIDLQAAKTAGVVVSGTLGGDGTATPLLTWGLILAITRNLLTEADSVKAGGWQIGVGMNVHGKTLGLLGLGNIGQQVACIGTACGMRPIAWSQNLSAEAAAACGVERVEKDQLFQQADVLTVHLKLGERSRDLVGRRELALMKPEAYLVNTSRGPIITESALIETLQARRIAGAALDVFDTEPLAGTHPFRHLPNVLATPHIGYVTETMYRNAYPQIVESIEAWLHGSPIRLMTD
ncbi:MAG: D-2-hydroxyacid dehydrogenase family protein [Janthinobacterium lividum]